MCKMPGWSNTHASTSRPHTCTATWVQAHPGGPTLSLTLPHTCPAPCPQDALSPMVRRLMACLPSLGPQDFASLLHALGTFGVHPGPKVLAALTGPVTQALPR